MWFKKNYLWVILGIIFLVALVLRFYHLTEVPNGFHIDEANLGYNAYSLLKTGRDDNGQFLPLYNNMFQDFNPTGYHYLTILPVAIFGLTIFATRFPAALFGSIMIFPFYFLASELFENKKVGIVAALLAAIAPWSIMFSRSSAETLVATCFILFGLMFLIQSLRTKKVFPVAASVLFFILAALTYPAPRVFLPLLFFVFLCFPHPIWKEKNTRYRNVLIGGLVVMCVIIAYLIFSVSGGTGRFNQVSIFTFPETKLVSAEEIREDGVMKTGVFVSRVFHNKLIDYGWTFADNYFKYFNGEFLFTKGGLPAWFSVPQVGVVLLFELPFILYGMYITAKSRKMLPKFLFVWLVLSPVVAAMTVDDSPNLRRALVLFPVLEIFAAVGFVSFLELVKPSYQKSVIGICSIILFFNFSYFLHQYFVHYPIHKNWYRNEGFDTMVADVEKVYNQYDTIIVTKDNGGIFPLILFYTKYDPATYQREGSPGDKSYTGFGKFFFVPQACPASDRDNRFPKGKILYVESGQCTEVSNAIKQYYISRLDGTHVFHMVYE